MIELVKELIKRRGRKNIDLIEKNYTYTTKTDVNQGQDECFSVFDDNDNVIFHGLSSKINGEFSGKLSFLKNEKWYDVELSEEEWYFVYSTVKELFDNE